MVYKLTATNPSATAAVSPVMLQSPLMHSFTPADKGSILPHVNVPGLVSTGKAVFVFASPVILVWRMGIPDQLAPSLG